MIYLKKVVFGLLLLTSGFSYSGEALEVAPYSEFAIGHVAQSSSVTPDSCPYGNSDYCPSYSWYTCTFVYGTSACSLSGAAYNGILNSCLEACGAG